MIILDTRDIFDMPHFPAGDHDSDIITATQRSGKIMGIQRESEAARTARLQIKNRRRRYLEMHPEYFESSNLELAGAPALRYGISYATCQQFHRSSSV